MPATATAPPAVSSRLRADTSWSNCWRARTRLCCAHSCARRPGLREWMKSSTVSPIGSAVRVVRVYVCSTTPCAGTVPTEARHLSDPPVHARILPHVPISLCEPVVRSATRSGTEHVSEGPREQHRQHVHDPRLHGVAARREPGQTPTQGSATTPCRHFQPYPSPDAEIVNRTWSLGSVSLRHLGGPTGLLRRGPALCSSATRSGTGRRGSCP